MRILSFLCVLLIALRTVHGSDVGVAPSEREAPVSTGAPSVKQVLFITGNAHKLMEVRGMMGDSLVIDPVDVDLDEYQGDPLEIAANKVKTAYAQIGAPVIIEDASLCFNALGGLPGPYIKWFMEKIGLAGLIQMLVGFGDKTAYSQSVFAYYDGLTMDEPVVFEGRCNGTIVEPRGSARFGWDPIFQPTALNRTFAEMTPDEKAEIGHRGRAFRKLKAYLLSH